MNVFQSLSRTRHVIGELATAPIKGTQVRESGDLLEKVTSDLSAKRTLHERAKDLVGETGARVRDATRALRAACKKGRAALTAEGVAIAPHASDGNGHQDLLARADVLVTRGSASSIKLPALVAARDGLNAALVMDADARNERRTASAALKLARQAWADAYACLRAAIESELRKEGRRGPELKGRLVAYFPKRIHGKQAAEASSSPAPKEEPKPSA